MTVEIVERDVAQGGADLVTGHRDVHAREGQAFPVQEVVFVDAVLQVDVGDVDAAFPAGLHGGVAGGGCEFGVALGGQGDGADGGIEAGCGVGREGRNVQAGQVDGGLDGERLRGEDALEVELAIALDAGGGQGEVALAGAHGQAVGGDGKLLQRDVQRGAQGFVAGLELGQFGAHAGGGRVDGAVLVQDVHLGGQAKAAVQQLQGRKTAHGRGERGQGDVAQPDRQFERQGLEHERALGANPAAVGAVVDGEPQVDGLVLDLRQRHAFDGDGQAGHGVVEFADGVGDVELAFVDVEGVERDLPFGGRGGGGRGAVGSGDGACGGGRCRGRGRDAARCSRWLARGCGGGRRTSGRRCLAGRRGGRRGGGADGGRSGCGGGALPGFCGSGGRCRVGGCRGYLGGGLLGGIELGGVGLRGFGFGRATFRRAGLGGGGLGRRGRAAKRLELVDHVLPVQVLVAVAAGIDLRGPQADVADVDLAGDGFEFEAADGQGAPGGQAFAGRVAQVELPQAQVADDADLGWGVLGLFEHDLQVGIEQRAFQLEGQRHGPDVGPFLELQAGEGHPQG
jgi:hypothetical protein